VHSSGAHTHGSSHEGAGHVHPEFGQTVFDDHLICLECGVSMKMLKRHLQTVHGVTPREYRAKWGLSDDYPMVAANYAKLRSSLALESGLGLKPDAKAGRLARHGR
jgi:predicted transcriptional regulator